MSVVILNPVGTCAANTRRPLFLPDNVTLRHCGCTVRAPLILARPPLAADVNVSPLSAWPSRNGARNSYGSDIDDVADRPSFAEVVSTLVPRALASCSAGMIRGGGGGGGCSKEQSVPRLSIYSISSDVFQKASDTPAGEGLAREKAAEIFKSELAGTLDRLFKAVVTQHRLSMPAQKAVGLGTYYRTIKDGPAFLGDASIVPAMDKFCSQRNQVIHEDVLPNVATIRQHALTCSKVLRLLHDIYPM